jgi:uncharacterized protein YjbJ (UPF0337 family)
MGLSPNVFRRPVARCVRSRVRGYQRLDRREEFGMSGIDKMKNKAEELSGEGKEAVGEKTGDRDLQAEGQADQASGNLKQAGEKVKDVFK